LVSKWMNGNFIDVYFLIMPKVGTFSVDNSVLYYQEVFLFWVSA
jgi:hypothetical protein